MSEFSRRHKFADWPNVEVPKIGAGVYAIWNGDQLVYCGMSGRGIENRDLASKKRYGLVTRLDSHASGRLSGDQFCVYVANRIVIPQLVPEQLEKFSSGELTLDILTKEYIRSRLEYQYANVGTSAEAFDLERRCRSGQIFGCKPLLNPLSEEIARRRTSAKGGLAAAQPGAPAAAELVRPLVEASAAKYAQEKGITPRDCP